MAMRKHINLFLVLLMLGAQLALAQHATVHFAEQQEIVNAYMHQSGHDSPSGHHGPHLKVVCQLCLFSKGISHTITPVSIVFNGPVEISAYKTPLAQSHITRQSSHGYLARGPPAFLI